MNTPCYTDYLPGERKSAQLMLYTCEPSYPQTNQLGLPCLCYLKECQNLYQRMGIATDSAGRQNWSAGGLASDSVDASAFRDVY